jgi:hypothetical protein
MLWQAVADNNLVAVQALLLDPDLDISARRGKDGSGPLHKARTSLVSLSLWVSDSLVLCWVGGRSGLPRERRDAGATRRKP